MTQETIERKLHPELDEVEGSLVDFDDVLKVIKQSTFLITPQKDALIRSLQILHVIPGDNLKDVLKAYDEFKENLKDVLKNPEYGGREQIGFDCGKELVSNVFQSLLGVNIDDLSTMEGFELKRLIKDWSETTESDPDEEFRNACNKALTELNEKIQGPSPSTDNYCAD